MRKEKIMTGFLRGMSFIKELLQLNMPLDLPNEAVQRPASGSGCAVPCHEIRHTRSRPHAVLKVQSPNFRKLGVRSYFAMKKVVWLGKRQILFELENILNSVSWVIIEANMVFAFKTF